jgi:hypothetical protein
MSPDPYKASAGPNDPGSWNRYTYVLGDPINLTDHLGLYEDGDGEEDYEPPAFAEQADGVGGSGATARARRVCCLIWEGATILPML